MGKISKGRGGQSYSSAHYTGVLAITYIGIPYIIVGFSQKRTQNTSKQCFVCLLIAILHGKFFIKIIWTLSNAECLQQKSRLKISN